MQYMLIIALVFLPSFSYAATYYYVNTQGELATIESSSADEAIQNAPNRVSNSGVALDMGVVQSNINVTPLAFGIGGSNTYHYVTNAGVTGRVTASDPESALLLATNRLPNSGVAIDMGDTGFIITGTSVPSTQW